MAGRNFCQKSKINASSEKKTKIRIEILTLSKLFTRLLVLLEQIKAGNNSCKLKIKLDK